MAENSNIEWTDHTFNPWIGCIKVTDACKFCYAEEFTGKKLKHFGKLLGVNSGRHFTANSTWNLPRKWNKIASRLKERHKVFCASLADVFEDNDSVKEKRNDLWQLIKETPYLDWLILTKRPENISMFLPEDWNSGYHNVWLGTSIGSNKDYKMIEALLNVKVKVRFLSCEPLIGPIDLKNIPGSAGSYYQVLEPIVGCGDSNRPRIDWVIVGGESGLKARECNIQWILDIVKDCTTYSVPVLVKQLGSNPVYNSRNDNVLKSLKLLDKKGGDINEFPAPLRLRQYPVVLIN